MEERIILVDENDKEIGSEEKLVAHLKGLRHRCFSIFIFNKKGELLLQKRAKGKYHSGGLWSNTVCGHPRPGEDTGAGASRGLQEEMGISCVLEEKFVFEYEADLDKGIHEHEIDHVFFGNFEGEPVMNPEEAEDFKWISLSELEKDLEKNPSKYTFWLKVCLPQVIEHRKEK